MANSGWLRVYDVQEVGYDPTYPLTALFFTILLGVILYFLRKNKGPTHIRIFLSICFVFMAVFTPLIFWGSIYNYNSNSDALSSGKCTNVEGPVENFYGNLNGKNYRDTFDVKGAHFEYSDGDTTADYHKTAYKGGLVNEKSYVRICYVHTFANRILRLELRNSN